MVIQDNQPYISMCVFSLFTTLTGTYKNFIYILCCLSWYIVYKKGDLKVEKNCYFSKSDFVVESAMQFICICLEDYVISSCEQKLLFTIYLTDKNWCHCWWQSIGTLVVGVMWWLTLKRRCNPLPLNHIQRCKPV